MKKKSTIIVVITTIVLMSIVILVPTAFAMGVTTTNISSYESLLERKNFLPNIEEFDNSENIDYYRFRKIVLFFESNAYNLKVTYNNDEYIKEKLNLDKKYDFYEDKIVVDFLDEEDIGHKNANFKVGDYNFRTVILPDEINVLSYPKEMLFVGTNDFKNEIVYIYFFDSDLDFINKTLDQFIIEECNFK